MDARATLAHDDRAGGHRLAREALHAQVLRVAVPPVPAGADALLVCHEVSLPNGRLRLARSGERHLIDANLRESLAVPLLLAVALTALALEDDDLLVAP